MHPHAPADRVLRNATVLTIDARDSIAQALAIHDGRIAAVGSDADVARLIGAQTKVSDLGGRTVMPGLIDGHAHMDREGLKSVLPSVSGVRSIKALIERVRAVAADVPKGQWVVTMPLGDPPAYVPSAELFSEGRLPNRHDLDQASSDHPILIRSGWGYWSRKLPLVCVANSRALELAGITRGTVSPTDKLVIERDAQGEPTGVFYEHEPMPIAEFSLFRLAPNFTLDQRVGALAESMRLYNAAGTTGIFEGHGTAPQTIRAYQRLRETGRQTVRSHLVFSPGWSGIAENDVAAVVRSWGAWLAGRGLGDEWLRVSGVYTELDNAPEGRLRALCAPQTGWAGFCYDSGLPRHAMKALMLEAARLGLRVCGIWENLIDLYAEVHRETSIAGLRWTLGHQRALNAGQIAQLRDMGVAITAHTNAHVYHRAEHILREVGPARENEICPLRSLLDAGVPLSLGTDNVPISLFQPIWLAAERIMPSGKVIAPAQKLTRAEALRAATMGGAWLCQTENETGSLEPGKAADLIVLPANPLTCDGQTLRTLTPDLTMVGGKVVYERSAG
jgi:predicted amidohydrolase YtcJ